MRLDFRGCKILGRGLLHLFTESFFMNLAESITPLSPDGRFVAPFNLAAVEAEDIVMAVARSTPAGSRAVRLAGSNACLVRMVNLITPRACRILRTIISKQQWLPVDFAGNRNSGVEGGDPGSMRASWYSPELAETLWGRLKPHLPHGRVHNSGGAVDWAGHARWTAVGVNPLMRFIRYSAGGGLVPHYDGTYIESDERRTLMSVVLYLGAEEESAGGETVFLADEQNSIPLESRDFSDKLREEQARSAIFRQVQQQGDALIFDHRLLHEGARLISGEKLVLRTDILFVKS